MKIFKKITTLLMCIILVFIVAGCGCQKQEITKHVCDHVCDICGNCQDSGCSDFACKGKCTCVRGLHDRKVSQSSNILVNKDGISEYIVIASESSSGAQTAAGFIANNINSAVGSDSVKTVIYNREQHVWGADKKYICVGVTELFQEAGLAMPNVDLSGDGFYIKTAQKSVFLETCEDSGFQVGAIAMLEEMLGYDMITHNAFTIYDKVSPNADVYLPNMEIIEKPDFQYRVAPSSTVSDAAKYGMGFTMDRIFIEKDMRPYHNSFNYLPPNEYYSDHPNWYGPGVDASYTKDSVLQGQLCYTARGRTYDEDGKPNGEYGEMIDTVVEQMIVEIQKPENANNNNIAFTEQDSYDWCNCSACKAEQEKYGDCTSANCILFCNDLEKVLNATLQEQGIDRVMTVYFFSYHATVAAPAVKNSDGTYSPIDGLKCNENVGVIYAPIQANFYYDINSDINSFYEEQMYKWNAVCDKVSVWLYQARFQNYFYPYCSWQTIGDNARFCYENGANYFFNQDQFGLNNSVAFSGLKVYLTSKSTLNSNFNQLDYTKKYFQYAFGDASEVMHQLFREVQIYYAELNRQYPSVIDGTLREAIANKAYWPKSLLEHWLTLIDSAYEQIAHYQISEPALYQQYHDMINLESLSFRFILCSLYVDRDFEDSGELTALRKAFKADCEYLKIDRSLESEADLESYYRKWGID